MSEARMMYEYEEELALEAMTRDSFHVTDDGAAAWCVRKIVEANAECDQLTEWFLHQIEKSKAKRDATVQRMTAYLREYAEEVPMKETKTMRSYAIPGGRMIFKKATTKLEHDDEKIMADLKKQGRTEYIKTVTTEKLDWAGLKKDYLENGEAVDGITTVEVPETFEVKVEG